jgi:formiminotetrahydrofolate cyclodeaminase
VGTDFRDGPLTALLDDLASGNPLPGAGSAAALVVATSAALLAMAARRSRESWEEAIGVAAQAEALRARALELAEENRQAYKHSLAVLEAPPGERSEQRDAAIDRALSRAAEVPLEIARAAADAATLGEAIADRGDRRALGDTVAAVFLADGAARAATGLVQVNLTTRPGDPLLEQAQHIAEDVSATARRVGRIDT